MKMTQKTAVFAAITGVLTEAQIKFEEGMNVATVMTKELRGQVNAILCESFRAGKIDLDKEYTDAELKNYVSGLQSNWIRKDNRLNGGVKYIAKNPGSRAGSGDPELKALRALLSTQTSDEARSEIQGYIDAKVESIQASKVKSNVDFSALPEELRAKFSK